MYMCVSMCTLETAGDGKSGIGLKQYFASYYVSELDGVCLCEPQFPHFQKLR